LHHEDYEARLFLPLPMLSSDLSLRCGLNSRPRTHGRRFLGLRRIVIGVIASIILANVEARAVAVMLNIAHCCTA
jgi:hypothetical protein